MNRYRTELKFLCPEEQLMAIEERIGLICERDSHSDTDGRYRIRSLYFDSPDSECYLACKSGENDRKKYRVRIYNESSERISLECKEGLNGKKKKESILLTPEEFDRIRNGELPETGEMTKIRLDFENKIIRGYRPAIVVGYTRTAYVYPAGDVRITFDRDITAIPAEDFFDSYSSGIPVLPKGSAILEVKYTGKIPRAIVSMINDGKLKVSSYSKYAICRDAFWGNLQYSV